MLTASTIQVELVFKYIMVDLVHTVHLVPETPPALIMHSCGLIMIMFKIHNQYLVCVHQPNCYEKHSTI